MKNAIRNTSATLNNGSTIINSDEKSARLIPAMKVANLKRTMDGAEQRMLRLETELAECRAIIRRKYKDVLDENDNVIGRDQLHPAQVFGVKLARTRIEKDLATAKGDFFKARKAYRAAVSNNFQVGRKSIQMIREENKIERESNKLIRMTKEILREHGSNGGAKEFQALQNLALQGDVKAFRSGFNEVMESFDPAHHTRISGVGTVKTEIIHAVMEELTAGNQEPIESLTGAVVGTTSNNN